MEIYFPLPLAKIIVKMKPVKIKLGIYRLHEITDEAAMSLIEKEYQSPIDILSVYRAWNRCQIKDDLKWLDRLKALPRDIMLTWEPWQIPACSSKPFNQPEFSLQNIISGRYDSYISAFAGELDRNPRIKFLRIMHEMNGDWYPWSGTVNGNTTENFILAWHHIRNIIIREVSSKIKWVWSPFVRSYPDIQDNRISCYFPGDAFIDLVGLDGYNWGDSMPWSKWESFEEIFSDAYGMVTSISRCPVMISETASCETGGDKGLWITQAFNAARLRFKRVESIIWFDIDKECDWTIASSPGSLKSFQANFKDSL